MSHDGRPRFLPHVYGQYSLPQQAAFPSADRYYATALHELGHWTGHASRLDRDLAHPFGGEGYIKELRAKLP
ncbi:zincin-like metallopeptidase domain-containing protein [Enterobacter kobei]|uniref:zincin-like metallopeptidase domain-containing protein n=1 Tax=Enterobacter kobei TaxID=208224 RepID=UPI00388E43A2